MLETNVENVKCLCFFKLVNAKGSCLRASPGGLVCPTSRSRFLSKAESGPGRGVRAVRIRCDVCKPEAFRAMLKKKGMLVNRLREASAQEDTSSRLVPSVRVSEINT